MAGALLSLKADAWVRRFDEKKNAGLSFQRAAGDAVILIGTAAILDWPLDVPDLARRFRRPIQPLSVFVFALGVLTGTKHVLAVDFGIDQLLVVDR
jgi:hypothetical protein